MGMKAFKIRLTLTAASFIAKLHPENRKIIRQSLDEIRLNPYSGYDLQEELSGFKSFRSKRYRVIYKVDELEHFIDVYLVGHRRDVYEQLGALLRRLT
jgi:mRNA interferase RelE/StbE